MAWLVLAAVGVGGVALIAGVFFDMRSLEAVTNGSVARSRVSQVAASTDASRSEVVLADIAEGDGPHCSASQALEVRGSVDEATFAVFRAISSDGWVLEGQANGEHRLSSGGWGLTLRFDSRSDARTTVVNVRVRSSSAGACGGAPSDVSGEL